MIDRFLNVPLAELQSEAFRIRKVYFGTELTVSVPDIVSYHSPIAESENHRFVAISVTGKHCPLQCEHCKGKLLESMIPAEDPETFLQMVENLQSRGVSGILVSGGANQEGEVPLKRFIEVIKTVKDKNPLFKIIVHTGLPSRKMAKGLKDANVDQVLMDVIGDDETIKEVYHLNKRVEDYEETLLMLKEVGHHIAPHIVIGHHFGRIKGEWKALEMVTRTGVDTIVLVVFKPLGTFPVKEMEIPRPELISRISAIARILNPSIPIRMGCIRPAHPWKVEMEKGFILSGVNTIAYPLQGTIDFAREMDLKTKFVQMCCSLI